MNYWTIINILLLSLVAICASDQTVITVDCSSGNDILCNDTRHAHPCKTLHTALEIASRHLDGAIHINSGNCPYNKIRPYTNIDITGDGSDVTTVECSNGTGFGFINISDVIISGLTLLRCGQLRDSTTLNGSANDSSVMLFRAALYFLNVTGVIIDDVVVSNSIGMGVAMYNVSGDVNVSNSMFSNNRVPSHEANIYPGGGGFSVEFSFCKPGVISCAIVTHNGPSSYLFHNCTFHNNNASTINPNHTSYPTETFGLTNQQFGRGGGLSVFFKGHSVQNVINISNCTFDSNDAVWGGGFHSDIVDYSTGNVLTLVNCNFINNRCHYNNDTLITTGTGGGGARVAFLFYDPRSHVTNNSVQFINCMFQSNGAYYGGGLSCRISKESNVTAVLNSLELVDCTWVENVARTGSGFDVISHAFPDGLSPVVKIVNCKFTCNNNSYSEMVGYPLGIGALYADNIPVNFSGNCHFTGNTHSAIAAIGTYLVFNNDTDVMFYNNSGWHGAGMALLGNAYFIIYHNTSFQFINNIAKTKGGAIYYIDSGQKDFLSTQRCLLYYYDLSVNASDPNNWRTTFHFSGNNATYGRSIYCTTLLTCIWNNIPGDVTVGGDDIKQVFKWNNTFHYDDDQPGEIATDAVNITNNRTGYIHATIPPGQFYPLNFIKPVDDRRQPSHPAISVETSDSTNSLVYITTNSLGGYTLVLHGTINNTISVTLHTVNNRPYNNTIYVTLGECPPGFHASKENKSGKENVCQCSTGHTLYELYGITDCDNEKLVAQLNPQFWAGYDNDDNETLKTSDCPQDYCKNHTIQLPDTSSSLALEQAVCSNNRHKRLCGRCQQDHYVYVNSPTYQCGPCNDTLSNHSFLILVASKYVPLTIMMSFIMFFDISLVDGPLNSYILYCQILVTLPLYNKIGWATKGLHLATGLNDVADFIYNLWNLRYFEYFIKNFCAFKSDSTLPVLAQEYIPAFYLLFLCVMLFIVIPWIFQCCAHSRLRPVRDCALKMERMCIRFRYHWSVKNSVIHSLTTFLVLSYSRITLVTFKLLTPAVLYGPGGQDSHYQKSVVWFDGTMSYFGSDHLPYALGALLMFIIFVLIPPLFLLSYPLVPALMTRLGLQDYWIVKKLLINPLSKCIPIFDAFQSCYKDEYRYFAGLLFVYRVLASAVFAFTPTTSLSLAWMLGFLLVILLLHCTFQPYKKRWHNFIEGSVITVLAAISIITFYRLFQAETTSTPTNVSFWIQIILMYCPLVYFLMYTSVKVFLWLRPRIALVKNKLYGNNNGTNRLGGADLLNSRQFPARMEDDGDNYSTTSDSTSESLLSDDGGQQQEQQDDDDDVEMIHPVEWDDPDDNHSNLPSPYGKTWATL